MPQLQSIASFPADVIDLLEAVGYMDARELCAANPSELMAELVKANELLGFMSEPPTANHLADWKIWAREALGSGYALNDSDAAVEKGEEVSSSTNNITAARSSLAGASGLVDFEEDPGVQAMLDMSLEADPIPADLIKQNNLAVSDIAEGVLLSECEGDVEMHVMTTQQRVTHQRQQAARKRSSLMVSRIRNFGDHDSDDHHVKPLDKGRQRDVVSLSEGLNAGLTPDSRRFVRGVLHPDPWRVRVSAFFAVLMQCWLVVTIITVPLLIIYDQLYNVPEVMWWIIGVVSCMAVSALCYLIWGLAARCRVCGQRQFAPKKCLKNRKAHHIPWIGYILPTALHAIFYKWFYCTYCGTAVRLKK